MSLTMQDKTRQDNNSTESKVTRVAFSSYKKCISLLEIKLSARHGTLQCSAGPEWYACHGIIDTLTSSWAPAVGRPSESAGCLAACTKNLEKNTLHIHSQYKKYHKQSSHVLCQVQFYMYDESAGSVPAMRWRMRLWTPRDTDAKSLTRVHHCPFHALFKQPSIPNEG